MSGERRWTVFRSRRFNRDEMTAQIPAFLKPDERIEVMPVADHLKALGEAEKRGQEGWDLCNEECQRSRYYEQQAEAAEEKLVQLRSHLQEAVNAGRTLALHTHGRSENREVAEAKEQLERARAALLNQPPQEPER